MKPKRSTKATGLWITLKQGDGLQIIFLPMFDSSGRKLGTFSKRNVPMVDRVMTFREFLALHAIFFGPRIQEFKSKKFSELLSTNCPKNSHLKKGVSCCQIQGK